MTPKKEPDMRELAANLELLLESLVQQTESTEVQLQKVFTENEHQREDLSKLTKIVIDGNGSPPILTRMALLEQKCETLLEEIKISQAKVWQLIMLALPGVVGTLLGINALN